MFTDEFLKKLVRKELKKPISLQDKVIIKEGIIILLKRGLRP